MGLVDDLKEKWEDCENQHADVFRYKLNVTKEKVLEGSFKFFVQVRSFFDCTSRCDVIKKM